MLFVSSYRPGDRFFGSDTRTQRVLRWLSESGIRIHFAHVTRKFLKPALSREMRKWISTYHTLHVAGCRADGPQPRSWKQLTCARSSLIQRYWSHRQRSGRPLDDCVSDLLKSTKASLVWVNHTTLAPLIATLPRSNDVLRIVDTHDVLHLRDARFIAQGVAPEQEIDRDAEQALLSRFDLVLAIQDRERELLHRILPRHNVITVGHAEDVRPQHSTTLDVCFVGSQYIVNELGLLGFLERSWPIIRAQAPQTRLKVVGGVSRCPSIVAAARRDERIVLRGIVRRLEDIYSEAAVAVCPIGFGSGLSIKLVEALAHGKAVVASPLASEGLEDGVGKAFWVADEPADFAGQVAELLQNNALRQQLEKDATEYATMKFSAKRVWFELSKFLELKESAAEMRHCA